MERRFKKRYLFAFLMFCFVVFLIWGFFYLSHPKPTGTAGAKAESLARAMQKAANITAWQRTGAITWTYSKRNHHIWDRKRSYAQVSWSSWGDKITAQFVTHAPKTGLVTRDGKALEGKDKRKALKKAYAAWINDSFWLNPVATLFSKGTQRKFVAPNSLLVEYNDGGLTPGDSFLFVLNKQNLPAKWHMWTSNIPIDGLAADFDKWLTLPSGAKISTQHKIGFYILKLTHIKSATNIQTLLGKDPFTKLHALHHKAQPQRRTPASAPAIRRKAGPAKQNTPPTKPR